MSICGVLLICRVRKSMQWDWSRVELTRLKRAFSIPNKEFRTTNLSVAPLISKRRWILHNFLLNCFATYFNYWLCSSYEFLIGRNWLISVFYWLASTKLWRRLLRDVGKICFFEKIQICVLSLSFPKVIEFIQFGIRQSAHLGGIMSLI